MNVTQPLRLLGGLTAQEFMKRHWQKKPLLVRGAIPGFGPLIGRKALFDLAADDAVESRLVTYENQAWGLRRGPLTRRMLPPLSRPGWSLLVQGVDLRHPALHSLLGQFRFVPEARLDDLMISYATDGGGVGPHTDSYDVFLLQAQGRRRWRIGRQKNLALLEGAPLKILADFQAEEEYLLEPGDMLYLPPRYAHDGVAQGECQTYSVGFRAPRQSELARALLERLAEDADEPGADPLYRDPGQSATETPGAIPPSLRQFAQSALASVLADPAALDRALGEYLSEPKPDVWFEATAARGLSQAIVLDRRTRMLHDDRHLFINGESWRATGRDARLMRLLADRRRLERAAVAGASAGARTLLLAWQEAGWLHETGDDDGQQ